MIEDKIYSNFIKKLMTHILVDATRTIGRVPVESKEYYEDINWIYGSGVEDGAEYLFSFANVCKELNLCNDYIRRGIHKHSIAHRKKYNKRYGINCIKRLD